MQYLHNPFDEEKMKTLINNWGKFRWGHQVNSDSLNEQYLFSGLLIENFTYHLVYIYRPEMIYNRLCDKFEDGF